MTDEVADQGAALLLDPGPVVLAVGPGTGELEEPIPPARCLFDCLHAVAVAEYVDPVGSGRRFESGVT